MDANVQKAIFVDPINYIAEIEGMATYEDLIAETLRYSCLPSVVPSLKSMPIGNSGAVADKLKVKLIPAKKYLKITYKHFNTAEEFSRYCQKQHSNSNLAYFDGIIFHKNKMYAIESEFVHETPFVSSYKYKSTYYQAIQHKKIDYLRIEDYIWRLDPKWFWFSKYFFMKNTTQPVSNFLRKIKIFLNKYRFMNTIFKILSFEFKLWNKKTKPVSVMQPIDISIENGQAFLDFFQKEIVIKPIKPIWVSFKKN